MKPTNEELRAAIEWAMIHAAVHSDAESHKAAAIFSVHLETFDEERAFLDATMREIEWNEGSGYFKSDAHADKLAAYRALVAKRERK